MSYDVVDHNFVQIYQACENLISGKSVLWESLLDQTPIAASHSCEKIFTLVTVEKTLDLLSTIQGLQNLIVTSESLPRINTMTRLITRLLMYNEQLKEKKLSFYHTKTHSHLVHPFTMIVKHKPDVYYVIMDECDYLFKESQHAMSILDGFIKSIFLTELNVDANAILTRLSSNIMLFANQKPGFLDTVYETFSHMLSDYPMHKEHTKYFMILDFLLWMTITIAPFFKNDRANTNDFLVLFFDRLMTVSSEREPIISYLYRLERIMQAGISDSILDIIWTGLSYALLVAHILEEQQMIMDIMKLIIQKEACHISVLRVSYLPLYQLMTELNDKNTTVGIKNLKSSTMDMIAFLQHRKSTSGDSTHSLEKLQTIMANDKPYGFLTHLIVYLNQLYNNRSPADNRYHFYDQDIAMELNILFSTPFVHSEDEEVQCRIYSYIQEIISVLTIYKFPAFLFLLRVLNLNCDNPRVVTHIFTKVIPKLASTDDPIMTSKVLQVILSCISSGQNSSMACLGVKALEKTFRKQTRVWQELKRVFTEWVLRRKSVTLRRRIDLSNTGPIKMELAILTSMRDLCKDKPKECASDILPLVISLLQSCQDLSMASLSLIVSIINHCVNAGFVEPRSIWSIVVVYLSQYAFDHGIKNSILLVKRLCEFYSIAGARNDISEHYIQFKETLLNDYILPLIESGDKVAAEHAMKALASFPAQDIATILPEKASEYVKSVTPEDDHPNSNQPFLLATLVSNELEHMRRGLFKEENTSRQSVEPVMSDTKRIVNDAGRPVGELELELRHKFTENWENARVAPGLRSGYAIAMLHMIDLPPTPTIQSKDETWNAIGKTKWYRFMMTQFTDVSLTDHLLLRISSVGSWQTFFKNTLLADSQNDVEAMVSLLVQDLWSRLERSTVPGVTCNIALAITGLISALRLLIPSFAASCASEVIEKLMNNYIDLAGSPLSHSAHLMSEEVQFAARFALGYLGPCVVSNEKMVQSVYTTLIESATNINAKYRNIDTAVDLVQFANGYSAGHFVAELAAYPSMTEAIETMRDMGIRSLLDYCRTQTISDSRTMGILMGLASRLNHELMDEELLFATESLQMYLSGQDISKGRLLGSLWLCAVGAKREDHIHYEISSLVESALASASSDPSLAQHFYHFTVCYAQIQYHTYLFADASSDKTEEFYHQAFAPFLNSIETDDASSNYRIASLFGIGSLVGINYIYENRELMYLEAQRYSPQPRQVALEKISQVAGIKSRSAPTGNLKSGRVAAAVCGKVIEHVILLQHILDSDHEESKPDTLLSASSEPSNYNRLNNNTSYLRAIYDQLVQLSATKQENNLKMLITSLVQTPGPLPAVNWFNLLVKVAKISPSLQELCFSFAATHAATSFSLSEFLMTQTASLVKNVNSVTSASIHFLFSNNGAFDSLLELSGLQSFRYEHTAKDKNQRRGMNAVVKKISISPSRIMELIQLLCQKYKWFESETRMMFWGRIRDHMYYESRLDEDKQKLVGSIRGQIYDGIVLPMLNGEFDAYDGAYEYGISDVQQLFPTGKLSDWQSIPAELVGNRVLALCKLLEKRENNQKQNLMRYMSLAMTYLIGLPIEESRDAWFTIADEICFETRAQDEQLGWVIRLLDAFVVYLSGLNGPEDYNDEKFAPSLYIIFNNMLRYLVYSPESYPYSDIQQANTIYLMGVIVCDVGDYSTSQQEQIVKRVFKLMEMTKNLNGTMAFAFFEQIAKYFPKEYVIQYESNY